MLFYLAQILISQLTVTPKDYQHKRILFHTTPNKLTGISYTLDTLENSVEVLLVLISTKSGAHLLYSIPLITTLFVTFTCSLGKIRFTQIMMVKSNTLE